MATTRTRRIAKSKANVFRPTQEATARSKRGGPPPMLGRQRVAWLSEGEIERTVSEDSGNGNGSPGVAGLSFGSAR